jgi:hypothetical protein
MDRSTTLPKPDCARFLRTSKGSRRRTLEQIERISRPSGDGPAPHDEGVVVLYERLVLLALAENAVARQQAGATKAKKAS